MMNNCDKLENMTGIRYQGSRRKTRLEKWLIALCILLMFMLAAMAIFIVIALYSNLFKEKTVLRKEIICNASKCSKEEFQFSAIKEEENLPRVCNSLWCVQEAADIIKKIDFNVPPCKNFYQFACGSYVKNTVPSTLDNTRDVISDIERETNHKLRGILEGLNNTRRWENELKMKKFHKSCVDMRKKALSTREIVQNILRYVRLEQWPYSLQLEEKLATIMAHGGRNPLFNVEFEGMNTVMLQEPKTILQEDYLISDDESEKAVKEYRRMMIEIFTRIGYPSTAIESEVDGVIDFETSIAEIARDQEDDEYSLLEISQVESVLPRFQWLQLFENFYQHLERVGFKANDINVILKSPGYLEELVQLLHDTEPKVVENYVMWSFLFQFLQNFDISLARYYHDIAPFINPKIRDVSTSDWESCILLSKSKFREPLHHRYAKEVISDVVLQKVNEIDKHVKDSLEKIIQSDGWKLFNISNSWREMEELSLNIPYKDVDTTEMPGKLYPFVRMTDDFIENIFQMERETVTDLVITGSLEIPWRSEDVIGIRPLYEFAGYGLPLSALQPPHFAPGMPSYSTYAALGFPLARKLSRYLQELSKANEIKSKEVINSTSRDVSCFEGEYMEFLRGMQVDEEMNSTYALNNYLHSTRAIHLAFEAYKAHEVSNGIDGTLPGLEFDPDQLFFIRHASLMCEVWTEEVKEKYLQNRKSPAEFSVNSVLRNSEEFAKAFNCPQGSNMNQNVKCLI